MRRRGYILGGLGLAALLVFAANSSWLASASPSQASRLLAHRGVYQRYDRRGLTDRTCTAKRIFKPVNTLLENTLSSTAASIAAGADVVELDIQPTSDGQFVAFHDWGLECRTDGHGVTREHSLAQLKALDVGYGYTFDGGRTFPFRGRFRGAMPSLAEALATFPKEQVLINIKSDDPAEADQLDAYLKANPQTRADRLSAYGGGDRVISRLAALRPGMRPFSGVTMKRCALRYLALGWSGYMPRACRGTTIFLPQNYAWAAWGYPYRLQARFRRAGSYIYLIGPQHGGVGLDGVNTPEQLARTPRRWSMGVLTDSVEVIGPLMKARRQAH